MAALPTFAQTAKDTTGIERFSAHAQGTEVVQYKPSFQAAYSGVNSLVPEEETRTSVTATLFLSARAWRGASLHFDPEMAGGSGLSGALGVASSTNGETFRVGDPQPQFYNARLFLRQDIALGTAREHVDADANQLAGFRPKDRVTITVGKIGMADLFDISRYAHDPRTQFLNWGLMSNGAWDYAANVRGYTPAFAIELFKGRDELRYALALLPTTANGATMQWDLGRSRAHMLEYARHVQLHGRPGVVRLLAFHNTAPMGSYRASLALASDTVPSILATRRDGRTKWGIGLNAEQELGRGIGAFLRAGWNDGMNETWAFTEIDREVSAGVVLDGSRWHRGDDKLGLAGIASGLSDAHRDYLAAGGTGFMLGDGALDYAWEKEVELYYSCALRPGSIWLSGAYQFVEAPGYNAARGPVNVLSLRLHVEV
ncbi:MAG: carbohydrate porin [Bacteroidetes bacterium]|nr:carbohydrate porin [Bacteroidota bacterium]